MKKSFLILVLFGLLLFACGAKTPVVESDSPQITPQPSPVRAAATRLVATATVTLQPATLTPVATSTVTPFVSLFPPVTFIQDVVCREGPDPQYFPVVRYSAGQTSQAQSRSEDGTWLVILSQVRNKSTVCWVPVGSVDDFGGIGALQVSNPPPLPVGASRAVTSKGVCGVNRQGAIVVQWFPEAFGTGYYVYRNGKNIATVYGSSYIDHDTPGSKTPYVYTYVIQAFNSVGLSKVTASASVTLCD